MTNRTVLAVLIFLSLFVLFCEKNKEPVGSDEDLGIYGIVTDLNGVPLKDVGVHLIFLEYPFYGTTEFPKIFGQNSIVLSYFDAEASMNAIMLQWATASESDNLGFKILRANQQNGNYVLLVSYENNPNLAGHLNADTTNEYLYMDTNVVGGMQYWYKLVDVAINEIETEHGPISETAIGPVYPTEYGLSQNYPNPFNPTTTIQFQLPQQSNVQLNILSWQDRDTITTLIGQDLSAGVHQVQWNGKNKDGAVVTNNLYIYRMEADTFASEKVMCLQMLDPEQVRSLNAVPLVKTNSNGKFFLKFSSIPLGQSIVHTDVTGQEVGIISVSQNMKIVLIKDGYQDFVEELQVDGNSLIKRTYRLTPN